MLRKAIPSVLVLLLGGCSGSNPAPQTPGNTPAGLSDFRSRPVTEWVADLKSQDLNTRKAAYAAIRAYGPASVEPLTAALADAPSRKYVVRAFMELGTLAKSAGPKLQELLKDPDKDVRLNSIQALARMGKEMNTAVPGFIEFTRDPDPDFRRNAALGLPLLVDTPEQRAQAADALAELVKDPDSNIKNAAINGLAQCGRDIPVAIKTLTALLKDQDPKVRSLAARSFPSATKAPEKRAEAVTAVVELLKDKDDQVRQDALDALANFKAEAAPHCEAVIALNEDKALIVRQIIPYTLSNIAVTPEQKTKVVDFFLTLQADKEPTVRNNAITGLGMLRGASHKALPTIINNLASKDREISALSFRALRLIVQGLDERAIPEIPAMLELLKTGTQDQKTMVVLALGQIGPPAKDALPLIQEIRAKAPVETQPVLDEAMGKIKGTIPIKRDGDVEKKDPATPEKAAAPAEAPKTEK
jgi:HEAT repeat protein